MNPEKKERYLFDAFLIQFIKKPLKSFSINKTIGEFLRSLRNEMTKLFPSQSSFSYVHSLKIFPA